MSPARRSTRPGIGHPNQKNGGIEIFSDAAGTEVVTGTANQVLTVGSDGMPAFAALAAIGSIKVTAYTSGSGTWTKDANTLFALVRGIGGGGGGGGADADPGGTIANGGGGGGGGAYSEKWIPGASLGATESRAVGAAGSAGSNAGGTGGTGGTTTFGSHISAGGGVGGTGTGSDSASDATRAGGAGGTASSGDLNVPGEAGKPSSNAAVAPANFGGGGGDSAMFGFGGVGGINDAVGSAGTGYGGGGGGGADDDQGGRAGGAGAAGYLIVIEFIKG